MTGPNHTYHLRSLAVTHFSCLLCAKVTPLGEAALPVGAEPLEETNEMASTVKHMNKYEKKGTNKC